MNEEYRQDLLAALKTILEMQDSGRAGVARLQLDSLIKHVEGYETQPS